MYTHEGSLLGTGGGSVLGKDKCEHGQIYEMAVSVFCYLVSDALNPKLLRFAHELTEMNVCHYGGFLWDHLRRDLWFIKYMSGRSKL